jgi:hypothetical protein
VAYPVRPATLFLCGHVLAPANLVWAVQLVSLRAFTAYLTLGGTPGGARTTPPSSPASPRRAGAGLDGGGLRQRGRRRLVTAPASRWR